MNAKDIIPSVRRWVCMLREDEPDGAIILVLEDKTKNKKKTLAISKIKGNDF